MVNRTRGFLFLAGCCALALGVLYFFGMSIPYVNLHLGKTEFFLGIAGLVFLGLSHPLWRRVCFILSLIGYLVFSATHLKFSQVWYLPIFTAFPYPMVISIMRNRKTHLANIIKLYSDRYGLFLLILSLCAVLITYRDIVHLYFEGDEWYRFRTYIPVMQSHSPLYAGIYQTIIEPADFGFHQSFFVNFLYPIVFSLFKTASLPYFVLSLLLHSITSTVAGYVAFLSSGRKRIGVAVALGFAVLATHSQAVTWIDAVLNTQLATLFGLSALVSMIHYIQKSDRRWLYLNALFLLLGLWSKETALAFVFASVFIYYKESNQIKFRDGIYLSFSIGIFLALRVIPSLFSSSKSSLTLFSSLAKEPERGEFLFRLWLFPLKIFSQILIPQEKLIDMSAWLTDMQYPFFAMEKLIRGSTYVNFIQTIVPEMLSICFSILAFFLFFIWTRGQYKKLFTTQIASFVLGCVPIVLITLIFPWWGTVSLMDSRHLYHLSIFILLLGAVSLDEVCRRYVKAKSAAVFFCFVITFAFIQFSFLQQKINKQLQTGIDRHMITSRIVSAVGTPKDRLIIYTTSNKSYYGFAEYMLPFQTSFAHMLPILFSKELNDRGIEYPVDFYGRNFFARGGLVAQGYEEREGKAIGYYLDPKMLQRAVIDHQIKPQEIFAFRFDGDNHSLEDVSGAMHERIENFIRSRVKFVGWKPEDFSDDRVRFLVHPTWNTSRHENQIQIKDASGGVLFQMEIVDPKEKTHSQFSLQYGIANQLRLRNRDYDFDTERIEYYFNDPKDHRIFLMAGNNMKFYILTYTPGAPLDDFLQSFEFWDDNNDAFLFGKKAV